MDQRVDADLGLQIVVSARRRTNSRCARPSRGSTRIGPTAFVRSGSSPSLPGSNWRNVSSSYAVVKTETLDS